MLLITSSSTIVTCSNPFCSIAIDFDDIWIREHADLVIIEMITCFRGRREFHDDNDNVGKRLTKGDGLMIMIKKIMMKCGGGGRRGFQVEQVQVSCLQLFLVQHTP